MKRIIQNFFFLLAPLLTFAKTGIPEQDRGLIYNTTVTGILIVIFALTVVAVGVGLMSRLIRINTEKKNAKLQDRGSAAEEADDTVIAIATALHLEIRAQAEDQKAILTLRKALRPFSGWNNKAYGMRER
ncbi:MAG: OadG family protein [Candidatus Neomarinimicrobiota bacterium]|jgi:Na+-transporting methylmalonyl-CoA/oxaloacetate decarboxylase gamma subunit|nr:OadG family protein [Candidatus Neomarinimicrobiota bacterium]